VVEQVSAPCATPQGLPRPDSVVRLQLVAGFALFSLARRLRQNPDNQSPECQPDPGQQKNYETGEKYHVCQAHLNTHLNVN